VTLTAEQVLQKHARLTMLLRDPNNVTADFFASHMRDTIASRYKGVAGMFYPAISATATTVDDADGRKLAVMIGADLFTADTVQVTNQILSAMQVTPGDAPTRLLASDIPFPSAFVWLDKPWDVPDRAGDQFRLRAITWRIIPRVMTSHGEFDCVRVTLWNWAEDELRAGRWDRKSTTQVTDLLGVLWLAHVSLIPLGVPFEKWGTEHEQKSADAALIMYHKLWTWLGMEIIDTSPVAVSDDAHRKAARRLHQPRVRVVRLRKIRHATDTSGSEREVNWRCCWIVHAHDKHLHVNPDFPPHKAVPGDDPRKLCMTCGGETRHIRQYVKGPDGLPLRVTETVFKLAR
jgi:hypothetical protein